MRYGQLVIGPAGSGKSTYCNIMARHGEASVRMIKVVNLDPAAEHFDYPCFAGQIELYTHLQVMQKLVKALQRLEFSLCAVFILDTQFMLEMSKFFAGTLVALSTMISLELPAVNVLSKMDLLSKRSREVVEELLDPDSRFLALEEDSVVSERWNEKYRKLNDAIGRVVQSIQSRMPSHRRACALSGACWILKNLVDTHLDDYSIVTFTMLDITDEQSVGDVLMKIDNCIQYGEAEEVRDRYPQEMDLEPENGRYE